MFQTSGLAMRPQVDVRYPPLRLLEFFQDMTGDFQLYVRAVEDRLDYVFACQAPEIMLRLSLCTPEARSRVTSATQLARIRAAVLRSCDPSQAGPTSC
jgi:hypothetical protein